MPILLDTSMLARLANVSDAAFPIADRAVSELHRTGEVLHLTAQNLIEFRNVATRPTSLNGLGLSVSETESKAAVFEQAFPLLLEGPDIYQAWKSLVSTCLIAGSRCTMPDWQPSAKSAAS